MLIAFLLFCILLCLCKPLRTLLGGVFWILVQDATGIGDRRHRLVGTLALPKPPLPCPMQRSLVAERLLRRGPLKHAGPPARTNEGKSRSHCSQCESVRGVREGGRVG
jgi:hypothetical protein